MANDGTGRRPKVHIEGDVERAARQRRAQSATPVEIDSEATPPPMAPPDPRMLEGFESLAPELQRQLISLWNAQRAHDIGLMRLWNVRNANDDLSKLQNVIGTLNRDLQQLQNLPALLSQQSAATAQLMAWKDQRARFDAQVERALELHLDRLEAVEKSHIKLEGSIATLAEKLTVNGSTTAKGFDELEKSLATLDARVRSLEDDRIKYKAKAATVATLASLIVAFVAWLIGRFAK
jgi:DNA repair exonuclease SbcCD ATPase subunit